MIQQVNVLSTPEHESPGSFLFAGSSSGESVYQHTERLHPFNETASLSLTRTEKNATDTTKGPRPLFPVDLKPFLNLLRFPGPHQ
jgi:hypothetical protein